MSSTGNDITSTFAHTIDVDRDTAEGLLTRVLPMRSLVDSLAALGLDDRAIWTQSCEANGTDSGRRELLFTLVWRFNGRGSHAILGSGVRVDEDAVGRSVLAVTITGRGSDSGARERVLAAWPIVEEIARGHFRRLGRSIEQWADDDVDQFEPRLREAV